MSRLLGGLDLFQCRRERQTQGPVLLSPRTWCGCTGGSVLAEKTNASEPGICRRVTQRRRNPELIVGRRARTSCVAGGSNGKMGAASIGVLGCWAVPGV
jgi:hypothetical protein